MDDITFGTGGWRARGDRFSDERVRIVGQGIATYLRDTAVETGGAVAVGYDARATSEDAAESLADVLSANGFDVSVTDRDRPTPVLAYAVARGDYCGGVMVTASHNPPEYNGIKFIPGDAVSAMPSVTDAIEARLGAPTALPETDHGTVERFDPVALHAEHSRQLVGDFLDVDLSDLTVVYDAIYGSGRGVTDTLLEEAGATVIRRRCERDPTFGGQAPEPSPETLAGLPEAVAEHDADLGIANDGDADRITVCSPDRGVLSGHLLFAVLFEALLTDADATGPAIRTVSTTFLIDRIAEAHGVDVHEVPVGFKWIADGMATHDGLFGGEESGGYTIRGHIGTKDGVLIALLAAAVAAVEPFDDRLDRLFEEHRRIYADKRSVACDEAAKPRLVEALEADVPDRIAGDPVAETVTVDGFKFLLDDGSWVLLRPSGTEPKIRVYAETTDPDRLEPLLDAGSDLVAARLGGTGED
ncbi:Phosphomannomutase [Halopenitus malekzadehii]|uniref:Phosphomannomutase n=1 Tax=Halopenitus malekzadehii TaxID=1267564 RepID=A0A1H6I5X1_9EURY|nr:phosphoglucomutase [Halopenitus malekzadehii]SEH42981.1 Phosphomannomutase [Halopenitus malekzadehii]